MSGSNGMPVVLISWRAIRRNALRWVAAIRRDYPSDLE